MKYELLTKHLITFESNDFEADVYKFVDLHPEMELTQYSKIIENNGIDLCEVKQAGVSDLDAVCVCAMIVANIRAERFSDGAILSSCEDGTFGNWLALLKEIDV